MYLSKSIIYKEKKWDFGYGSPARYLIYNNSMLKLTDFLKKENILTEVVALDWVEAVNKTGNLMVKLKLITPAYTIAMIETINKFGAYSVITPGVALPHARPEAGSLKIGLVLLKLKKPVNFGSPNDPVGLLFGFSAIDKSSHSSLLKELATLLSDSCALNQLKIARNKKEILSLIAGAHK